MDRLELKEFRNQLNNYNANIKKITCFNLFTEECIEDNLDDILDDHALLGAGEINQTFEWAEIRCGCNYDDVITIHGGWLITATQHLFDNIHLSKNGQFKGASLSNFKTIITVYDFTLNKALNQLLEKCEDNYNEWIQEEQKKQGFIKINEYIDIVHYWINEVIPMLNQQKINPINENGLKEIQELYNIGLNQIKHPKIIIPED